MSFGSRRPTPATRHPGVPPAAVRRLVHAGHGRRSQWCDHVFAIDGQRFDQYDIGHTRGCARSGCIDRFVVDVVALETTHERRCTVLAVERDHADVAATDQSVGDERGRADGQHRGIVGQLVREL